MRSIWKTDSHWKILIRSYERRIPAYFDIEIHEVNQRHPCWCWDSLLLTKPLLVPLRHSISYLRETILQALASSCTCWHCQPNLLCYLYGWGVGGALKAECSLIYHLEQIGLRQIIVHPQDCGKGPHGRLHDCLNSFQLHRKQIGELTRFWEQHCLAREQPLGGKLVPNFGWISHPKVVWRAFKQIENHLERKP